MTKRQLSAGMSLTHHMPKQTHSQFSEMPLQSQHQENLGTITVQYITESSTR